jgi:hypothetical protein
VKLVLRPVGPGNWRPLVLVVEGFPRIQGSLFRGNRWSKDSIDADRELVKSGDVWTIDGRKWRVAEVKE